MEKLKWEPKISLYKGISMFIEAEDLKRNF